MTPKILLLSVVLVAAYFWQCQAYKPCVIPPQGQMDEKWFIEAAAAGFYMVEHSDCDNCEKQEAWSWLKAAGRTIPRKMCWMMHVTTNFGNYVLPYNCKYNKVTKQECELDTSNTDLREKVKFGGHHIITHSDNKTYVAGTSCIFDKESFWWIISSHSDLSLPPGVLEQIKADFIKFGFQSGNVAVRGKSPLYLNKLSAIPSNC